MSDIKRPELKPGDIFGTAFPGAMLGTAINGVQRFYAADGKSELSHFGRVVDSTGLTFEALGRYRHQANIWDAYGGPDTKLIIFRHDWMSEEMAVSAHQQTLERYRAKLWKGKPDCAGYRGKIYPGWRLPMFMAPVLAKVGFLKMEVCSESALFHWFKCGLVGKYKGWNPDKVADYCVHDRYINIIYHQNIQTYDPRYLDRGGER